MERARQESKRFTWGDYCQWPSDERWELVGGEAFAMSPSPSSRHQSISMALSVAFGNHFRGRPCEPFAAPMDVRLSDADVVQPDLLVVCDPDQIRETHVAGAPTLVVEILSPSTHVHDRVRKLNLYAKFGIQEYWIVTPNPSLVEILVLDQDHYRVAGAYRAGDIAESVVFPGLRLPLDRIFTMPIPESERIDEVRETAVPYPRAQ